MTIPHVPRNPKPVYVQHDGANPALISKSHTRVTLTPDDLLDHAITLAQYRARTESTTTP